LRRARGHAASLPVQLISRQKPARSRLTPGFIRMRSGEGPAGPRDARTTISMNDERRVRARVASGLRVRCALLNHRQLQHGHSLSFKEMRYEHTASIWKFDRIMVTMRNVWVYRAEFPYSEINLSRPKPPVIVLDSLGERQFGPRKHADRYRRLTF
jgi:hypothetical protein